MLDRVDRVRLPWLVWVLAGGFTLLLLVVAPRYGFIDMNSISWRPVDT